MLAADAVAAFVPTAVLLALAPGPDNLFVLTQSANHGRHAGLAITLGLCTGLLVHTTAVALGVAALIRSSPYAYAALKYLGAAYLLFLAWQAFRTDADHAPPTISSPGFGSHFRRGVLLNLSNPKVALFFLAFLPQFTDPERASVSLQLVLLGLLFIGATFLVFGGIAALGGSIQTLLRRFPSSQRWLRRIAGILFAGLAFNLALSNSF